MVSQFILDAVIARLSDVYIGFNIRLADASTAAGIEPFEINFAPDSSNFLIGQLPDDAMGLMLEAESFSAPCMAVYSQGSEDTRSVVMGGVEFAGEVTIGITVAFEIPYDARARDYEKPGNCIETAMIKTFNNYEAISALQDIGALYDGRIRRAPPTPGKLQQDSIGRIERFYLTFGVQTGT